MQSASTTVAAGGEGTRARPASAARATRSWARPTLAAALIYLVLSVLMVGQGLVPGRTLSASDALLSSVPWQSSKPANVPGLGSNFELADAATQSQPFLQYTRSQLPHVPLWNPYLMAGRPFLADAQSAVFSPFSAPTYVLPFWKSLAIVAILKMFLGAFGAFILGRVLGMRFGGALLTGVVFAFGTCFVIWLAWPLTSIFAWIPWALTLTELLIRRPGVLPAAGLAAVVGAQFLGGFPESSFHFLFVTCAFFVFRALLHRRELRSPLKTVGAFVVALAVGGALAALMLLPFLEALLHSAELTRRAHAVAGYWPRKYLGALFLHDYWGRPTQVDLEAFMELRAWYVGAATLMLAASALILRRSVERIAVALFAVFIVCIVIGLPPVFGIVSALPGFSAAKNERMMIYAPLCLALLAGWGLDDLSSIRLPSLPLRRIVLAVCAVIFCIPVAWMALAGTINFHQLASGLRVAWGLHHPPQPPAGVFNIEGTVTASIVRDSALLIWLPLAAAGVALVALRLRANSRMPVSLFVGLTVALVVVDLFRANMGFNPAIRQSTATPPVTGAIRYLQSQRPSRFIGVSTLQLSQPLPDDLAVRFHLYDARGYDYPVEKRFDALWRGYVAPGVGDFTQPEEYAGATPAALRALDLLSVSNLIIGPLQAIAQPLRGPGLHVAYRGKDAVVYANDRALPRVFVVNRQQTVAGDRAALAAATAPNFDGRAVAITEHPIPGLAAVPAGVRSPAPATSGARLTSYEPQRIVIDARTSTRGVLVLTDDFYPGWTATVDGRPASVQRVDYLLRGIPLAAGHHTVELRYDPASWRIGWIVSLAALLGLLGAVIGAVVARRRARR